MRCRFLKLRVNSLEIDVTLTNFRYLRWSVTMNKSVAHNFDELPLV